MKAHYEDRARIYERTILLPLKIPIRRRASRKLKVGDDLARPTACILIVVEHTAGNHRRRCLTERPVSCTCV
jgi:hypothetical protein